MVVEVVDIADEGNSAVLLCRVKIFSVVVMAGCGGEVEVELVVAAVVIAAEVVIGE